MPRYVFDASSGELVEVPYARDLPRPPSVAPHVRGDLPAYKSPLGTGWIDGRSARREDLARGSCREVDPSEFKATVWDPEMARRTGIPYEPPPPVPQHVHDWQASKGVRRETVGEFQPFKAKP